LVSEAQTRTIRESEPFPWRKVRMSQKKRRIRKRRIKIG
jgi:hypothetical protein